MMEIHKQLQCDMTLWYPLTSIPAVIMATIIKHDENKYRQLMLKCESFRVMQLTVFSVTSSTVHVLVRRHEADSADCSKQVVPSE